MELVTQNERGRNNRKYKRKESTESGILSASTSSFTSWCPSDNLRVPATSRLQKLHNVSLALKLLYGMGPFPRSSGQSLSSHLACCVDSNAAFTGGFHSVELIIITVDKDKYINSLPLTSFVNFIQFLQLVHATKVIFLYFTSCTTSSHVSCPWSWRQ